MTFVGDFANLELGKPLCVDWVGLCYVHPYLYWCWLGMIRHELCYSLRRQVGKPKTRRAESLEYHLPVRVYQAGQAVLLLMYLGAGGLVGESRCGFLECGV